MEVKNIKESSTPLLGMGVEERTQTRSPFIRDKVMFSVIAACLMTGCTHSEQSITVKPVAQQKADVLLVDPDRQHVPSKKIWRTDPKFNVMEQIRAWSQVNDYQLIWAEGTPMYSVMASADFTGDFKTVVPELLAAATSQHHSTYSVQFFENNVLTICMAHTCKHQEQPVTLSSNKLLATPDYLVEQYSLKRGVTLQNNIKAWLKKTDYQHLVFDLVDFRGAKVEDLTVDFDANFGQDFEKALNQMIEAYAQSSVDLKVTLHAKNQTVVVRGVVK